jgi:hypothetical protein
MDYSMTPADTPIRVLALIYPIERYVGHWACSSRKLEIRRILMSGFQVRKDIMQAVGEFRPEVIAVCGKAAMEYLDLLDDMEKQCPDLRSLPRVFRMQNSSLTQQSKRKADVKEWCRDISLWFRLACDPRWSWIFVQTLNDVEVVRRHLAPVPVSACPYGYDTTVFNYDLPELERRIDVGCYMNLRGDPDREALLLKAETVCRQRGWLFRFVEGVYWYEYARQIRESKIVLHRSIHREVPFRMYETTVFGTVFVTDPLEACIEELFEEGKEYLTYRRDLSDLEDVLEKLMTDRSWRRTIAENGRRRARTYTWGEIADTYVAPALSRCLNYTEDSHD